MASLSNAGSSPGCWIQDITGMWTGLIGDNGCSAVPSGNDSSVIYSGSAPRMELPGDCVQRFRWRNRLFLEHGSKRLVVLHGLKGQRRSTARNVRRRSGVELATWYRLWYNQLYTGSKVSHMSTPPMLLLMNYYYYCDFITVKNV